MCISSVFILVSLAKVVCFFAVGIESMVRAQSHRKDGIGSSESKGTTSKMKDLHDLSISRTKQNANSSSKVSSGKGKDREDMVTTSSEPKDSSTLRRSAREFRMQISTASNSNSRKSELLENQSLATPSKKAKIEREVKKVCQNSLRRSERIDKSSASGSSSSKKSYKSSDSSVKKKGNEVKNGKKKSVLVSEGEVKSKNLNERTPLTGKKRKQMTARTYRAFLSPQPAKKVRKSGMHSMLVCTNNFFSRVKLPGIIVLISILFHAMFNQYLVSAFVILAQ